MARDPRRSHRSVRAFRALLSLYPGEFRDEYGRELALVFADRYRDATSVAERALVWIEAVQGVLKEAPREHVHMILQDLRYAARVLWRSPAFAVTAILTLALGIGANAAIFQLVNAVGLQPLPVPRPSELAEIRIAGGNQGFGLNPGAYGQLTRPVWNELKQYQQAFDGMFAWSAWTMRVGERSDLRRVNGLVVSGDFFRVLGIDAWRGRLIEAADEAPCPVPRAVLSHAYWQREFGGRDIGAIPPFPVNGQRVEVIGVAPPGFFGVAVGETFDVALPLCREKNERRDRFDVAVMGRLRSGWTIERASAHVDALSAGIFDAVAPTGYSADGIARFKAFRLAVDSVPTGVSVLRTRYETALRLLLAITGLVLLIACANLANLLLARAVTRQHEVSVRLALGASRTRLVRQFLAESGLMALSGATLGAGLAQVVSRLLLRALANDEGAPHLPLAVDWRMLLFTAAVAVGTCVIFGVAPAVRASRMHPAAAIKSGGRGLSSRTRFGLQRGMVVTQIAVSLVLLVAAFLFVRSFYKLTTFDAGMRQEGITVAYIGFDQANVPRERFNDVQRQILSEIQSVPGVVRAGSTTNVPLFGSSWSHGVQVGAVDASAQFTWVSPGYFAAMGVRIVQGRDFALQDTAASPRVAVVNQAFVQRFCGSADPIGQQLKTSPEPNYPSTVYEIVGVIPDSQYSSLRGIPPPMVFAPDSQFPNMGPWLSAMIHSTVDHAAIAASVKRVLSAAHPGIVTEFVDFQRRIRGGLVRERLLAVLAGIFGLLAAVLAMVGLYGMIAFSVAQRRQEIGIRVALGATRWQVIAIVMREAATLCALGTAAGAALSLVVGNSASTLLFGLTPHDPSTLIGATGLLSLVAFCATYLPARAASRLDPLTAIRHE
jgi:putative ABC transport system permease protein